MPIRVLIDTCVWINLAQDHREQPVLEALSYLVTGGEVDLILPKVVIEEFARNKAKTIAHSQKSLQTQFGIVREAINKFGSDVSKTEALKAIDETSHNVIMKRESVLDSIRAIETLFKSAPHIPVSIEIKKRVVERALKSKAPYHRDKNSIHDAIILETYAAAVAQRGRSRDQFAFVTHNFRDFSSPDGDRRVPHPDLAHIFNKPHSKYWTSLAELIKEFDEDFYEDVEAENFSTQQPRRLSEILESEHLLFRQVWYNRHWNLRSKIEDGQHKIVTRSEWDEKKDYQNTTIDTVWEGALAAARRIEEEVGLENLGPWDDFEWGMLNGKLSTLRWVLGDEWDMLDT